ncbi:MAG: ClpX C4-type zinc finger [Bradyrhizobium sp.]|nr:ClpX C4-type zinc finger [Bradyrhizobium sp.]
MEDHAPQTHRKDNPMSETFSVTALPAATVIHCSFCSSHQNESVLVIAGENGAFICDLCVSSCVAIMVENNRQKNGLGKSEGGS